MNWDALGALAELAGAIGVIASLLYLGTQIRQSSRATKAEAVQSVQQTMVDLAVTMANDPFYSKITNRSVSSFLELSEEERGRLGWFWFAVMRTTETLYHHYLQGNADASIWQAQEGALVNNLRNPGFREWWRNRGYPFTSEFTEFVDAAIRRVEESGEQYHWFGSAE